MYSSLEPLLFLIYIFIYNTFIYIILPRCVQSSTPLSRSQVQEKEEGWRQEGHPAVTEVAPKPLCLKKHGMNVFGKSLLD